MHSSIRRSLLLMGVVFIAACSGRGDDETGRAARNELNPPESAYTQAAPCAATDSGCHVYAAGGDHAQGITSGRIGRLAFLYGALCLRQNRGRGCQAFCHAGHLPGTCPDIDGRSLYNVGRRLVGSVVFIAAQVCTENSHVCNKIRRFALCRGDTVRRTGRPVGLID